MYLLRCSNISREVIRQFEQPFNITLHRKKIEWIDEFSSGWYYEYTIQEKDKLKLKELHKKYVLNLK